MDTNIRWVQLLPSQPCQVRISQSQISAVLRRPSCRSEWRSYRRDQTSAGHEIDGVGPAARYGC